MPAPSNKKELHQFSVGYRTDIRYVSHDKSDFDYVTTKVGTTLIPGKVYKLHSKEWFLDRELLVYDHWMGVFAGSAVCRLLRDMSVIVYVHLNESVNLYQINDEEIVETLLKG